MRGSSLRTSEGLPVAGSLLQYQPGRALGYIYCWLVFAIDLLSCNMPTEASTGPLARGSARRLCFWFLVFAAPPPLPAPRTPLSRPAPTLDLGPQYKLQYTILAGCLSRAWLYGLRSSEPAAGITPRGRVAAQLAALDRQRRPDHHPGCHKRVARLHRSDADLSQTGTREALDHSEVVWLAAVYRRIAALHLLQRRRGHRPQETLCLRGRDVYLPQPLQGDQMSVLCG